MSESLSFFFVLVFSVCVCGGTLRVAGLERAGSRMCLGNDIHESTIAFVNIIIL